MKIEKNDLNKAKEVVEKLARGSTQQISFPVRLGLFTGRNPWLLRIKVGSVENKYAYPKKCKSIK